MANIKKEKKTIDIAEIEKWAAQFDHDDLKKITKADVIKDELLDHLLVALCSGKEKLTFLIPPPVDKRRFVSKLQTTIKILKDGPKDQTVYHKRNIHIGDEIEDKSCEDSDEYEVYKINNKQSMKYGAPPSLIEANDLVNRFRVYLNEQKRAEDLLKHLDYTIQGYSDLVISGKKNHPNFDPSWRIERHPSLVKKYKEIVSKFLYKIEKESKRKIT